MTLVDILVISLGFVTGLALLASLWNLYENFTDWLIARRSRPDLVSTAKLRLGRNLVFILSDAILFLMAIAYLAEANRVLIRWLLYISLFDYPLFGLAIFIYELVQRKR